MTERRNERQEIHCHACHKWVQFTVDTSLDGNHVLNCPECGHEHCRVVKNGEITDIRWDQRNGPTIPVASQYITCSSVAVYVTVTSSSYTQTALQDSWANGYYTVTTASS